MKFSTIFNSGKRVFWVVMVLMLMMLSLASEIYASVPYLIWGYVHNSDGSVPATGDITITTYLEKDPSGVRYLANTDDYYSFDIDSYWGYYPGGDGGETSANLGDYLIIEFVNTNSSSPFFGETNQLRDTVGPGSDKQFGDNDFALPVEISSFKANIKDNKVVLSWITQSERDNLGFYIYKSSNNESFFRLNPALIEGAGTSTFMNEYEYVDERVEKGSTYQYKLESMDINGQLHEYKSLTVNLDAVTATSHVLLQNYPNPFNPNTTIQYTLKNDTHVRLSIYNIIGDLIVELADEYQAAGVYSYQWSGQDGAGNRVPSGMYFYKLGTKEATLVQKMVYSK